MTNFIKLGTLAKFSATTSFLVTRYPVRHWRVLYTFSNIEKQATITNESDKF